jgi:hypothetical protein
MTAGHLGQPAAKLLELALALDEAAHRQIAYRDGVGWPRWNPSGDSDGVPARSSAPPTPLGACRRSRHLSSWAGYASRSLRLATVGKAPQTAPARD